jgi:hypothetical protein
MLLLGKPEGNSPLGKARYRWMDNISMDLGEIESCGVDWIDLVQGMDQREAVGNTVMNLRVPYYVAKFLSSCTTGGRSRRAHLHAVSRLFS